MPATTLPAAPVGTQPCHLGHRGHLVLHRGHLVLHEMPRFHATGKIIPMLSSCKILFGAEKRAVTPPAAPY